MVERTARAGVGACASALGSAGAAGASLVALACWGRAHRLWVGSAGQDTVEVSHGLEILALTTAGLVAGWLGTLLLVGAVATLPGRAAAPLRGLADHLAPRLAPRIAAGLVSTVVTLTPLGAAHAVTAPATDSHGTVSAEWHGTVSAGRHGTVPAEWTPGTPVAAGSLAAADRPVQAAGFWGAQPPGLETPDQPPEPGWRPTAPRPAPDPESISLVSRGAAEQDVVVVRTGDTLWHIAARHLGEDADAAAIAEAWPRWYEANRAVIGADPDFLLPGTRLVPPGLTTGQGVTP